ncbi:hypothetical protein DFH27DRAFT_14955 [Peziza echinospora]|nr:hypothetical protein DFH27DRAFT_14955 [Peziza echinospora]
MDWVLQVAVGVCLVEVDAELRKDVCPWNGRMSLTGRRYTGSWGYSMASHSIRSLAVYIVSGALGRRCELEDVCYSGWRDREP